MKFFKKFKLLFLVVFVVAVAGFTISCSCKTDPKTEYTYQEINGSNINVETFEKGYISTSGVAIADGNIYASDETKGLVYMLNSLGTVTATFDAGKTVNNVVVIGDSVYALIGGLDGELVKLSKNLTKVSAVALEHTPVDILKYGNNLFAANRFSNSVTVLNASDLSFVKTIKVSREPMALTQANGKIYAACHLPAGAATAQKVSADVSVIDGTTLSFVKNISMLNGVSSVKDICVSSDGDYLYVSNIFSRYAYTTTQLQRGWINTNGISIINLATDEVYTGVLLDDLNKGAANPFGIDCDNGKIVVALSGLNQVMIVDEVEMLKRIADVENGNGRIDDFEKIPDTLSFLAGAKTRINLNGIGARSVAIVDGTAYIGEYFSGTVTTINIDKKAVEQKFSLGVNAPIDESRMGEILWYDATECYEYWESCASCHPDARVDAFNWDNLNDSVGNPKQTKSMMYSHRTPPVMITGARESAELAVLKGMNFIQFNTMEDTQLNYINEFLRGLKPTQSPYLNRDGSMSDSAKRGEVLFEEYSCNDCHTGPNYTDTRFYKSPTLSLGTDWEDRDFVTPTLVETWRSGPYFFNGSKATMQEAVKFFAPSASESEVADIANFVLSIGDSSESYGIEQVFSQKGSGSDSKTMINAFEPDALMVGMTIRKQQMTGEKAIVRLAMVDENGVQIGVGMSAKLPVMQNGERARLDFKLVTPKTLNPNAKYIISIVDSGGNKLATDYVMRTKQVR